MKHVPDHKDTGFNQSFHCFHPNTSNRVTVPVDSAGSVEHGDEAMTKAQESKLESRGALEAAT